MPEIIQRPFKGIFQRREQRSPEGVYLISGPLGLWPFPILNTFLILAQVRSRAAEPSRPTLTTYEVNRDEMGRITSVTLLENIGARNEG